MMNRYRFQPLSNLAFIFNSRRPCAKEFPAALKAAQAQQLEAGENPPAVPDLSGPPEALFARISALLDNVSTDLEYGSLIQLFVPRIQGSSVVLMTHRDFTRVNTVHDQKFWKYHEAGGVLQLSTCPVFSCTSITFESAFRKELDCGLSSLSDKTPQENG